MQEVFSPFETTHDARKEPRAKKTRGPLRKAACKWNSVLPQNSIGTRCQMAKVKEWAVNMQRVVRIRDKLYAVRCQRASLANSVIFIMNNIEQVLNRRRLVLRFNALGNEIHP